MRSAIVCAIIMRMNLIFRARLELKTIAFETLFLLRGDEPQVWSGVNCGVLSAPVCTRFMSESLSLKLHYSTWSFLLL